MNLDLSLLGVSAVILDRIRKRRIVPYEELRAFGVTKRKEVDELYVPALNLLFLLGRIDYHQGNDSIEYVEL